MKQVKSYLRNRGAGIMKQMKVEFVDLSGDIVCEILCRLDSNTLSKCCSVCKTWYQIISDPTFADLCRQWLLTNSKLVVVDRWRPKRNSTEKPAFLFTLYRDRWTKGASKRDSLVTSRILQNYEGGSFCCNRITCDMLLCYDPQRAYLLNFSTGELHIMPEYSCNNPISYTYGYDASKAEYLLVAVEWGDERQRVAKLSFTVGQTCSGWKIIWDAAFPRKTTTSLGIILNNRAYWPSDKNLPYSKGKEIIVSMDLDHSDNSDAFCIIKSPPFIPETGLRFKDNYITLIDYKGSLGMVDTSHMATTKTLLLWLLKDRCSSLWIKKFHINLGMILSAICPHITLTITETVGLKSSKEGELIIRPNYDRVCLILNPETQKAQLLVVPRPPPPSGIDRSSHLFGAVFL